MNKIRILFALLLVLLTVPAGSAEKPGLTVLTSLPVTFDLTRLLAEGTGISVVSAVPEGCRMKDHFSCLEDSQGAFPRLAEKADAVVHIGGAWTGDPLYPLARRHNIRIVGIDASRPADPTEAGLRLLEVPQEMSDPEAGARRRAGIDREISPYIWLSLSNQTRMAELIAADLVRLSPEDAEQVERNLARMKRRLFRMRTGFESRLSEADSLAVLALSPDFVYLTDEWGLDVVEYRLEPMIRWEDEDFRSLGRIIAENDVKVVLSRWKPGKGLADVIGQNGATVVVPDLLDRSGDRTSVERMEASLESLAEGFLKDQGQ